jgi:hypothetical protein
MRSLEEETLYYAIATLLLFGIPVLTLFLVIKFQDIKSKRLALEKSDNDYKERYGELAFQKMLKERASFKSNPFAKMTNSPTSGIWHTRTRIDVLPQFIEINHPGAQIGNAPHRLSNLICTDTNKLSLTAEWPYPKNPQLTTVVVLELQMSAEPSGGSSVRYKYSIAPDDDPFAAQIVELTNFWLQNLLEKAKETIT